MTGKTRSPRSTPSFTARGRTSLLRCRFALFSRGKGGPQCRGQARVLREQCRNRSSPQLGRSPKSTVGQGRMFAMGNGGSSCDAAHFAVEFLHPVTAGRRRCRDQSDGRRRDDDCGRQRRRASAHVFVRQLIAQARRGDGLIGFSTSGNSDNLLALSPRRGSSG